MACLGWLVPGPPRPDTHTLHLLRYTTRLILSPEKYNNAQINTQAYISHKQCSTPYHIIKEYQKQTSLENNQDFKGS
jgi:hypothetical protein